MEGLTCGNLLGRNVFENRAGSRKYDYDTMTQKEKNTEEFREETRRI